MVETTHFRINRSILDDDYRPIDHYIWVVEPTRDGELYLWRPNEAGSGLAKMSLTMKKLVEDMSPHNDKENGVIYTGDKKTTMVTLNAATGTILKQFGSSGSYVNKVDTESCFKPNALADGEEECSEDSTITLGRTEYTVSIQRSDGSPIASLRYSEWGPNTQDNDLILQNLETKDRRYITGQHDGKVYGFEYGRFSEERPVFTKTLASPVARVFDVLHRWGSTGPGDPELIVLPQPPLPASDEDALRRRNEKVFINRTEEGSWYALSGSRYPLILSAPDAPIHRVDWWRIKEAWDLLPEAQKSKALVGIHQLPVGFASGGGAIPGNGERLSLPPPEDPIVDDFGKTPIVAPPEPPKILDTAKKVPELVVTRIFELVSNPAAIIIFAISLYYLYKDRVVGAARSSRSKGESFASRIEVSPTLSRSPSPPPELPVAVEPAEAKVEIPTPDATPADAVPAEVPAEVPADVPADVPAETSAESQAPTHDSPPSVTFSDPPETTPPPGSEGADAAAAAEGKKKKGHRGRRGGVKHRKGNNKDKRENSQSRDDDPPQETVEEVISKAKTLVREPKLEPDIITVSGAADEVSGSILKMGSLEVNEAEQLGTGSNGTIVFAGKWDGRDVAVKRMLVQFNEIASQETRLLRESDDHPNGKSNVRPGTRVGCANQD
jgi:serine/threonine-protein kinase/endoribonuclease IRE1